MKPIYISKVIREARLKKSLSQVQLAVIAGISYRTVQAAEAGKREISFSSVKKIFKALKISFEINT